MLEVDHEYKTIHDFNATLGNFKTVQKLLELDNSNIETAKLLLTETIKQLEEAKKEFIKRVKESTTSSNHAGI